MSSCENQKLDPYPARATSEAKWAIDPWPLRAKGPMKRV